MIMGLIFSGIVLLSILAAIYTGSSIGGAVTEGAQAGLQLAFSIGGSLCLWSGVGHLLRRTGIAQRLGALLQPLLGRLFPASREDAQLREYLSANITANLLGLGNAATPMGIEAAKRLSDPRDPHRANAQLCRLIVLNTASIQLLPTTVAAVRSAAGCASPFDILPAVWVTSLLSATAGLCAAALLERMWKRA